MNTKLRRSGPYRRRYRGVTVLMPSSMKYELSRLVINGAFPSLSAAIRTAVEEAQKENMWCTRIQVRGRKDLVPVTVYITWRQAEALKEACGGIAAGVRAAVQRMIDDLGSGVQTRRAIRADTLISLSYGELRAAVEEAARKVVCSWRSKRARIKLRMIKEAMGLAGADIATVNSLLTAVLEEVLGDSVVEVTKRSRRKARYYTVDVKKFCGRR
jgi:Arc/MetJ-type ribon-helix-helix transcriptional regulator